MAQLVETWTFDQFGGAKLKRELDGSPLDETYFESNPINFVKEVFELSELEVQELLAQVERVKR